MNDEKKYTTLWEIEKLYNDKVDKKSGFIAAIITFVFLVLCIIIGNIAIEITEYTTGLYLFGFAIGLIAMLIVVAFTQKYVKIRIN